MPKAKVTPAEQEDSRFNEQVAEDMRQEVELQDSADVYSIESIRDRINALKAERSGVDREAEARRLLDQLPREKNAKELGTPCMEYAIKVMSSQTLDPRFCPAMLAIAKTQRALKNQGYGVLEIDKAITALEAAYKI